MENQNGDTKRVDSKRTRLVWAVSSVLLAAGLIWLVQPKPTPVDVAAVRRGTFRQELVAEGKTRAKERFTIYAPADGDLQRIELRVGTEVKKGRKLAVVDGDRKWNLVAPADGVVTRILRESGGPIRRGEPILEMADIADIEIVAEILTPDSVNVRVGASAELGGWGGEPIPAKVAQVKKVGFTKVSALGVEEERTEVVFEFAESEREKLRTLGENFHIECAIEIFSQADAAIVPVGALFRVGEKWAVMKVVRKKAVEQIIEVERLGRQEAWVRAGLADGEVVVLYPGDRLKSGTRVLPRK